MASPWTFVTVLLLVCLTMPTTPMPVTSQADPETGQSTFREDLGKVSSEIDTMLSMGPRLKDTLRQLTARLDAQEDVKSQGAAIKALAQDNQEQGQAIKAQGQDIKTQGQEAKKITNDLKIHGTQMGDLVDAFDELNTEFRDLRKGIVNRIESQDKKIEWSITDGSLAPRNTSWVEENFHTMMNYINELQTQIGDLTNLVKPFDCSDANVSGVYTTSISGLKVKTYCQVDHRGRWTVIQRRQDGSVNFTRPWEDYRQGFGDVSGEHWLGNDHIHALTAHGLTKLRIDLHDWDNTMHTVYYSTFHVAGAESKYALTISGFVGSTPPGDSLGSHNGAEFSTYDQDNDAYSTNCAASYKGGWWYISGCHNANLNGAYNNSNSGEGINWYHWKGYGHSLKGTIMMIGKP